MTFLLTFHKLILRLITKWRIAIKEERQLSLVRSRKKRRAHLWHFYQSMSSLRSKASSNCFRETSKLLKMKFPQRQLQFVIIHFWLLFQINHQIGHLNKVQKAKLKAKGKLKLSLRASPWSSNWSYESLNCTSLPRLTSKPEPLIC